MFAPEEADLLVGQAVSPSGEILGQVIRKSGRVGDCIRRQSERAAFSDRVGFGTNRLAAALDVELRKRGEFMRR